MKIQELIVGAPKGSQKDARLSPGTDDPSKYMRGGEWEAYREPQGISSRAGKVASKGGAPAAKSVKKRKKAKNESLIREGIQKKEWKEGDEWFRAYYDEETGNYLGAANVEYQHLTGGWHVRASASIKTDEGQDSVYFSLLPKGFGRNNKRDLRSTFNQEKRRAVEALESKLSELSESVYNKKDKFNYRWKPQMMPDPEGAPSPAPYAAPGKGEDGVRHIVDFGVRDDMKNKAHRGDRRRKTREGSEMGILGGSSGAGADNALVPRHRDATTINMVKDTDTPTRGKTSMPNSKAPLKQTKAKIKKSLSDTPGDTSPINESIPRVLHREYDADYVLRDDKDTEDIGQARIRDGVIELLAVRNDFAEDFNGHIMSRLLGTIVRDADLANANLAIKLGDPNDIQHKRFMERFGFRATGDGVMKRNAGAVKPPSVPTARL